jgi:urea carboxylase-associated protein 2
MTDRDARIAQLRARYQELKAAGSAPRALPGPSPLPAPAIANPVWRETLPAGWYWTGHVATGRILRLVNTTGRSAVAFTAWNRHEPTERFYHGDTVKIQWTARLQKGRLLLSEMGRVLASIVEDSSGGHDILVGGSTAASAATQFGAPQRNTRDNLIAAVAKLGLSKRDIPPVVSFFAPVAIDDTGRFVWRDGVRRAGDYVELRAEMDLMVALSNCPHPLDPAEAFDPGDVELTLFTAAAAAGDDICRTATAEAVRAFQNTDAALWS